MSKMCGNMQISDVNRSWEEIIITLDHGQPRPLIQSSSVPLEKANVDRIHIRTFDARTLGEDTTTSVFFSLH